MSSANVNNYPRLQKALKSNRKIVYLLGAGASMSLGNHTLSWPKWILCGRDFLSDEDSLELERRVGDWSADELIDAVTFLLERLKAAGTYEKYMEKTIGSLHSVNRCFENALCKIWRAGDIITTTNYDLQIEEAVGAEPISYSSSSSNEAPLAIETGKQVLLPITTPRGPSEKATSGMPSRLMPPARQGRQLYF